MSSLPLLHHFVSSNPKTTPKPRLGPHIKSKYCRPPLDRSALSLTLIVLAPSVRTGIFQSLNPRRMSVTETKKGAKAPLYIVVELSTTLTGRHLGEGDTLVHTRLLRQSKNTLSNDVGHNLIGTARNTQTRRAHVGTNNVIGELGALGIPDRT